MKKTDILGSRHHRTASNIAVISDAIHHDIPHIAGIAENHAVSAISLTTRNLLQVTSANSASGGCSLCAPSGENEPAAITRNRPDNTAYHCIQRLSPSHKLLLFLSKFECEVPKLTHYSRSNTTSSPVQFHVIVSPIMSMSQVAAGSS